MSTAIINSIRLSLEPKQKKAQRWLCPVKGSGPQDIIKLEKEVKRTVHSDGPKPILNPKMS